MTLAKVRKYNSFLLSFGLFYLVQNFTIGQIPILNELYIVKPILLKEVLFVATSIILNFTIFKWRRV
jgi:hypothetical protein